MYKIVIVTSRREDFYAFETALEKADPGAALTWLESGADALAAAAGEAPDLIVVDDPLADMAGPALIRQLLEVNAMINTVMVSDLSASAFHEATEGLGILRALPKVPDDADARDVLTRLAEVSGL